MKLLYIVEEYPSFSEYFILNEVLELKRRDMDITIFSIKKGKNAGVNANNIEVIYPSSQLSLKRLSEHIKVANSFKTNYWKVLADQINVMSIIQILKNLKCFSDGVSAIYRMKNDYPNHIHVHFINRNAVIGSVIGRFLNIKHSISAHANDIYTSSSTEIISKIKQAEFVVTCTQINKWYLDKVASEKDLSKIYHVYHGIDLTQWTPKNDNDNSNKIHLLTVARLVEKKGLIYLLKAIKLLIEEQHDVHLSIVGDGPLKIAYQKYIDSQGLFNHITLFGALNQEKVQQLYLNSDVFVLPCIIAGNGDRDGLPNVLLEALAVGIPVITTNASAATELVLHEKTGMIVPERDEVAIVETIQKLLRNPKLYNKLVTNGKEAVKRFEIFKSTAVLYDLFTNGLYK